MTAFHKAISNRTSPIKSQRSRGVIRKLPAAFTLVELLVVIAIIALLMAMLMPALARVRMQAKTVICQSQLQQWGSFFSMYTDDNKTSYMQGRGVNPWWQALEPYYKDRALLCCPQAKDPGKNPWEGQGTFGTWGPAWFPDNFYGSYGMNEWACNPIPGSSGGQHFPENYWRTSQIQQGFIKPLLLDAWWDQAWPEPHDWVPDYSGQWEGVTYNDMAHFCINRHGEGYINGLFMDYSISKVGLKRLWKFKWHKNFDTDAGPSKDEWPEWMKGFKEYK
jgi:prepilin-type N-terminal cleavage/methylation domain-containing protein